MNHSTFRPDSTHMACIFLTRIIRDKQRKSSRPRVGITGTNLICALKVKIYVAPIHYGGNTLLFSTCKEGSVKYPIAEAIGLHLRCDQRDAIGTLTGTLEMLMAALKSALQQKPHCLHRKEAWDWRFAFSQCPHWLQVRLYRNGITTACFLFRQESSVS